MSKTVIVKNTSVEDISFAGISIPGAGHVTINNDTLVECLAYDNKLVEAVKDDSITINDNSSDLSPYPAIYYLRDQPAPSIDLSFCDNTHPYIIITSSVYWEYADFVFPGYKNAGKPEAIAISLEVVGPSGHGAIRIVAGDPPQTVVQKVDIVVGVTAEVPLLLFPLDNVNEEPTRWILEACVHDGATSMNMYALSVLWPKFSNQSTLGA